MEVATTNDIIVEHILLVPLFILMNPKKVKNKMEVVKLYFSPFLFPWPHFSSSLEF